MDLPLSDQIMSLAVTLIALLIAGAVYADMYTHGMISAAPRDGVALLLFAVLRMFLARTVRSTAPAPEPEPEGD